MERAPSASRQTAAGHRLERATRLGHRPGAFTVQRLIYTEKDKRLHAYKTYGDKKIPWDQVRQVAQSRDLRDEDPTLKSLYKEHQYDFNGYLTEAIGEPVSKLKLYKSSKAEELVKALAYREQAAKDEQQEQKEQRRQGNNQRQREVAEALQAANWFWRVRNDYDIHYGPGPLTKEWALLPSDYIPEAPDLPGAETSVRSTIPGKPLQTYWEYVCVLIAIVKQEGYDAVKAKTGSEEDIDDLDTAVQALHDYYMTEGIQYDDGATRRTVMNQWGYSLVFSGPVAWADLHKHLTLRKNETYIVDIKDHTVKMKVKENLPGPDTDVQTPGDYYQFYSEEDNYNQDELAQQVLYVFKK